MRRPFSTLIYDLILCNKIANAEIPKGLGKEIIHNWFCSYVYVGFHFDFFLPSSFCVRKYLRSEKESETKPSLLQPKHFFIYFCLFVFWFLVFFPLLVLLCTCLTLVRCMVKIIAIFSNQFKVLLLLQINHFNYAVNSCIRASNQICSVNEILLPYIFYPIPF